MAITLETTVTLLHQYHQAQAFKTFQESGTFPNTPKLVRWEIKKKKNQVLFVSCFSSIFDDLISAFQAFVYKQEG